MTLHVSPSVDMGILTLDLIDMIAAGAGLEVPSAELDDPTSEDITDRVYVQGYVMESDRSVLNHYPTVDVSFFAPSYASASALAIKWEDALLRYPHIVDTSGRRVVVGSVEVVKSMAEVPWLDEAVTTRRFLGTYTLSVRR